MKSVNQAMDYKKILDVVEHGSLNVTYKSPQRAEKKSTTRVPSEMNAGATVDKLLPVDVINGFMIRETQLRRSLHGKVKDYLVIVGWSFGELSQVALRQVIVKV